ncbi:metallophosphoesterase [Desulfonatronovibrio magnus]|uniref:metallophosphoesterase n=1 Tax=Desulfonatronovibrio magnus TaxID=698827 RepID=UPI0006966C10|nr:metallophosphoesterase [Desulfonatronovibrio magnus]
MTQSIKLTDYSTMGSGQLNELINRLGQSYVGNRLMLQAHHSSKVYGGRGSLRFHPENSETLPLLIKYGLFLTGMTKRCSNNCLNYRIREHVFNFKNLPGAFHGLRILQLSDIHADAIPDGCHKLKDALEKFRGRYDLCVLTGDYRFQTNREYQTCLEKMQFLTESISCPYGIYGILGNHDFLEMVHGLESMGVRMLLNESVALENQGQRIWIAGVDDPHFYHVHDIPRAMQQIPQKSFSILLCHSPEACRQASFAGVDVYLCGHTHGGQMCLPGGIPVITNSSVSRKYSAGAWALDRMQGYTSRGCGASGLPARLNCPPEINLHILEG